MGRVVRTALEQGLELDVIAVGTGVNQVVDVLGLSLHVHRHVHKVVRAIDVAQVLLQRVDNFDDRLLLLLPSPAASGEHWGAREGERWALRWPCSNHRASGAGGAAVPLSGASVPSRPAGCVAKSRCLRGGTCGRFADCRTRGAISIVEGNSARDASAGDADGGNPGQPAQQRQRHRTAASHHARDERSSPQRPPTGWRATAAGWRCFS